MVQILGMLPHSSHTRMRHSDPLRSFLYPHALVRVHLSGVIACVSADMVYEEPARGALLPGLMAQLAPGYVDAVVLAPGSVGSEELEKVCVRGMGGR